MKLNYFKDFLLIFFLSVFFIIIYYNYLELPFNLAKPIFFEGDAIWVLNIINEPLDYWLGLKKENLGYPFGLYSRDFPFLDLKNAILLELINFFNTPKDYTNYNIFNLLNFFFICFFGNIFFKKLGFNYFQTILGLTLFSLVPYHFIRYEHILLMDYYMAVIIILLALPKNDVDNKKNIYLSYWTRIIFLILLGLSNPYYILYFFILVFISFVLTNSKYIYFRRAIFDSFFILLFFSLSIIISLLHIYYNGDNSGIIRRQFWETFVMPITLSELLIPINDFLSFGKNIYIKYTSYWTSQRSFHGLFLVQLGTLNSIGLIIGLFYLVNKNLINETYRNFSFYIVGLILFTSYGGLGTIFSFLIPQFRTLLNAFPLILLISISFFLFTLGKIRKKYIQNFLIFFLIIFSVLIDFKSSDYSSYPTKNEKFSYNKKIINILEYNNINNLYIFPFFQFPEAPELCDTNLFEPHSIPSLSDIKINYGASRNRLSDKFFRLLEKKDPIQFNSIVSKIGFDGIIIQKNCEKDFKNYIDYENLFSDKIYEDNNLVIYMVNNFNELKPLLTPTDDLNIHYQQGLVYQFYDGVKFYHYDNNNPIYPIIDNMVKIKFINLNKNSLIINFKLQFNQPINDNMIKNKEFNYKILDNSLIIQKLNIPLNDSKLFINMNDIKNLVINSVEFEIAN